MRTGTNKGILLLTLFVLGACGQNQQSQLKLRNQAPQSESDTGVFVSGVAQEDLVSIQQKFPEAEFRSLGQEDGLYEIFSVPQKEVETILGNKADFVEKNIYFKTRIHSQAEEEVARVLQQQQQQCPTTPNAPEIQIRPTNNLQQYKRDVIDLRFGQNLTFGIAQKNPQEKLDYLWMILPPAGSKIVGKKALPLPIAVSADVPGTYTIVARARNVTGICGYSVFSLGVTVNVAYRGAVAPRPMIAQDLNVFHHIAKIQANLVRPKATGAGAKIAIIDTGVNYNHQDLASNLLVTTSELSFNRLDEDKNGFIDDAYGWDFAQGDNIPFDDDMHGTHVAGIAVGNPIGIAPQAKFLPVKALNANGSGDLASIYSAVVYSVRKNVDIINMSLGGEMPTNVALKVKPAYDLAERAGILVIAAAGNGDPKTGLGINNDRQPSYPTSYPNANILSVASVDENGALTTYSNYGSTSVDIAAPGGTSSRPINSAYYLPGSQRYIGASGTSMATPVVAGAAALIKQMNPSFKAPQIKQALMSSVFRTSELQSKLVSGGIVNVARALAVQGQPQR